MLVTLLKMMDNSSVGSDAAADLLKVEKGVQLGADGPNIVCDFRGVVVVLFVLDVGVKGFR